MLRRVQKKCERSERRVLLVAMTGSKLPICRVVMKGDQVRGSVLVVVVVVMVVVKLKAKSGQDSKFISLIFPHQTNKAPNFPHHQKLRS